MVCGCLHRRGAGTRKDKTEAVVESFAALADLTADDMKNVVYYGPCGRLAPQGRRDEQAQVSTPLSATFEVDVVPLRREHPNLYGGDKAGQCGGTCWPTSRKLIGGAY